MLSERGSCYMKKDSITAYFCRVSPLSPYQGTLGEIENSLKSLQWYVKGDIQAVPLTDGLIIVCNDDGKLLKLPVNRAITDGEGHVLDVVVGNALVVRVDGEEFASIFESDIPLIEKFFPPIKLKYGNTVEILMAESLPKWGS